VASESEVGNEVFERKEVAQQGENILRADALEGFFRGGDIGDHITDGLGAFGGGEVAAEARGKELPEGIGDNRGLGPQNHTVAGGDVEDEEATVGLEAAGDLKEDVFEFDEVVEAVVAED